MTIHSILQSMPSDQQSALLLKLTREKARRQSTNKLRFYQPYKKQRDFHKAGATFSERLFMAGNQLGKTVAGGAEWAMHLTGRYPDWWDGATFNIAPLLWAGSVTGESTRDNPQRILIGPPAKEEEWGTGFVPADCIRDRTRAMGVPNLLDTVVVRWGGGGDVQAGESILALKAYEKGREKWQGPTVDGVWFDEEPPEDIYSEGLTRTNNGQRGQFAQTTFTPLLGMSTVVSRFIMPAGDDPGFKRSQRHVDDDRRC
jgi:phage terminase large subunit-like protein